MDIKLCCLVSKPWWWTPKTMPDLFTFGTSEPMYSEIMSDQGNTCWAWLNLRLDHTQHWAASWKRPEKVPFQSNSGCSHCNSAAKGKGRTLSVRKANKSVSHFPWQFPSLPHNAWKILDTLQTSQSMTHPYVQRYFKKWGTNNPSVLFYQISPQ